MISKEFTFRKLYLQEKFQNITSRHDSVALYGAGKHSAFLLEILKSTNAIQAILDDSPSQDIIFDKPVIKSTSCPKEIEAIVISSDHIEERLYQNAKKLFPNQKIYRLYDEAGSGPFENKDLNANSLNEIFSKQQESLKRFHNIHKGKRCFILGNGPSLNDTDLSKLKDEFTFGTNRIYLLFKELGFETSYYLSVNGNVTQQYQDDILQIRSPKFLSLESAAYYPNSVDSLHFLPHEDSSTPMFHKDISQNLWWGATVTYVAMQLAYYMGFQEVYLIGVDHYFKTKGQAHTLVQSDEDDENHFSPDYFKGKAWQLPDLETSELAYSLAKFAFENSGRKIYDATVNGKLDIFKKVDFNSLFS